MRAVPDKAPIEITNCHVHLFTGRHVPVNYPHWALRPVKRFPWLAVPVAWLLAFEEKAVDLRIVGWANDPAIAALVAVLERELTFGT